MPALRAPFPYDITIGGVTGVTGTFGFMLGKRERQGPLVATMRQEAPEEQEMVWDDWVLGMGLRVQGEEPGHYYYALGADCSIQNQIMLGPSISTVTPENALDTTNGISHFFEIDSALYALNGRYVKKRTADTAAGWGTTSKDFGAAKAALDVIVHKQNGASTTYAYTAMGDSEFMYEFDGTSWTQHASLYARAFGLAGRRLWRANAGNYLAFVDDNADPWDADNWSAANAGYIGEAASAITRLATQSGSGELLIYKTDNVYTIDEEFNDVQQFSDLKLTPDATNGKYHWTWEDYNYLTLNGRLGRIGPDLSYEPIGPERFAQNEGPVRGYCTAGAGTDFCAYVGLYNPDSQKSYLLKFGSWLTAGVRPRRIDAWHGSISQSFDSKIITAMKVSTIGAPSRHKRLYLGFSDGTVGWFDLPCTPNPYGCSDYDVPSTSANYVFMPAWHGGEPQRMKHLRMMTVTSQGLSSAPSVDVGTAAIGDTTASSFTETAHTASPGASVEIATDTAYAMTDIRVELKGSGGNKFKVLAMGMRYATQPPPGFIYEFAVLCEDDLVNRWGVPISFGRAKIQSVLRSAVLNKGSVLITWPDESSEQVTITNFEEGSAWDDRTRAWRKALVVKAIQAQRLTAMTGSASLSLT